MRSGLSSILLRLQPPQLMCWLGLRPNPLRPPDASASTAAFRISAIAPVLAIPSEHWGRRTSLQQILSYKHHSGRELKNPGYSSFETRALHLPPADTTPAPPAREARQSSAAPRYKDPRAVHSLPARRGRILIELQSRRSSACPRNVIPVRSSYYVARAAKPPYNQALRNDI